MSRTYLWSRSVPRAELDQRSREARLRLERVERLLVPRPLATRFRLRRILCVIDGGERRERRSMTATLSDRRPRRSTGMLEVWLEMRALCTSALASVGSMNRQLTVAGRSADVPWGGAPGAALRPYIGVSGG